MKWYNKSRQSEKTLQSTFFVYNIDGGIIMIRYKEKNTMRSPEEKEKIVLEYLNGKVGGRKIAEFYEVDYSVFRRWVSKYKENGIEGLKSKTGKALKNIPGRPKKATNRIEELERENVKLQIENERLKKGYYVKGVGQKKEYVSINNKNMK